MNARPAIHVQHLSKAFHIYRRPTDLMLELFTGTPRHAEFWSLRDISFEVARGEVVGIVGRNGAGKSTLLKIIAGTLDSTAGDVVVDGRVSAILELGTGFNPELSGRENVYLGGLCLGLTRPQIVASFDEIVAFSELDRFIDQPLRTYSSGMKSRLAFAVAISVHPDILIVDEALSVGDAKFRRKSFARMNEIRANGATILFVSHDTHTVTSFCDRAILLEQGCILADGHPGDITKRYLEVLFAEESAGEVPEKQPRPAPPKPKVLPSVNAPVQAVDDVPVPTMEAETAAYNAPSQTTSSKEHRFGSRQVELTEVNIVDSNQRAIDRLVSGGSYQLRLSAYYHDDAPPVSVGFLVRTDKGVDVFGVTNVTMRLDVPAQSKGSTVTLEADIEMNLAAGDYFLTAGVARLDGVQYDLRNDVVHFVVVGTPTLFTTSLVNLHPRLRLKLHESVDGVGGHMNQGTD